MKFMKEDKEREERITMEIVVDCYDSYEQFSGWYSYLEDTLKFPFEGIWKTSKNGKGEKVNIIGMGDFDYCEDALDMLVNIEYEGDELFEPLKEIFKIKSDDKKTKEAVEDWHYWVKSGNSFEDEHSDEYEDEEYD